MPPREAKRLHFSPFLVYPAFVERCFAMIREQPHVKDHVTNQLKKIINDAGTSNTLWSTDWDRYPLPGAPLAPPTNHRWGVPSGPWGAWGPSTVSGGGEGVAKPPKNTKKANGAKTPKSAKLKRSAASLIAHGNDNDEEDDASYERVSPRRGGSPTAVRTPPLE